MLDRLNMGLVWEVLTGCFLASFGCGRYGGHCANPKVAFNKTGSKIHSIRKRYSFSSPVSELTRNNILLFQILCKSASKDGRGWEVGQHFDNCRIVHTEDIDAGGDVHAEHVGLHLLLEVHTQLVDLLLLVDHLHPGLLQHDDSFPIAATISKAVSSILIKYC